MTRPEIGEDEIADAIVRIPRRLRASDGVSMYDLAASSGYFEHHDCVREPVIRKRLRSLPELVDEWLVYSENKRVGSGWYFRAVTAGQYEVGYYGGATGEHSSEMYADKFDACAKFIRQEMEGIRSR